MLETVEFFIIDAHPERSVDGPSELTIEYGTKESQGRGRRPETLAFVMQQKTKF